MQEYFQPKLEQLLSVVNNTIIGITWNAEAQYWPSISIFNQLILLQDNNMEASIYEYINMPAMKIRQNITLTFEGKFAN